MLEDKDNIGENGLEDLDTFLEFLKPGRPGTKVVVLTFGNEAYEDDIKAMCGQVVRYSDKFIAYREGKEIGLLVDVHDEGVRDLIAAGSSLEHKIYEPDKFLEERTSNSSG